MSDKVRYGVIGMGGRGFGFMHNGAQRDDCEVVAVADNNLERARRSVASVEINPEIHEDYHDLLARKDMDAVIITTPDYMHYEPAVAAFNAGKHCLIDKPITTRVDHGIEVLEAAKRSGKLLYMGFNMRHVTTVLEMKRLVDKGAVGKPFFLMATEYYNGGRTYMARWNRLKKYSGGLFLHKGSHDIDVLNWLNLPARPVHVSASAAVSVLNPDHLPFELGPGEKAGPNCATCAVIDRCPDAYLQGPRAEGGDLQFDAETAKVDGYYKDLCIYLSDKDTHDNAMAIIEYDDGSRAYHSEVFVTPTSNRLYTVIGDKGHMEVDLRERKIKLLPRWTQNCVTHEIAPAEGGHGGSDPSLLGGFIRCVRTGEKPRATGVDGVWSIAVACAAEIAVEEKRVVEISELLDKDLDVMKEE